MLTNGGPSGSSTSKSSKSSHARKSSSSSSGDGKAGKGFKGEATPRRKEQNRVAQRAFRVRQKAYLKDLEKEVVASNAKVKSLTKENEDLMSNMQRLQRENIALKAKNNPRSSSGSTSHDLSQGEMNTFASMRIVAAGSASKAVTSKPTHEELLGFNNGGRVRGMMTGVGLELDADDMDGGMSSSDDSDYDGDDHLVAVHELVQLTPKAKSKAKVSPPKKTVAVPAARKTNGKVSKKTPQSQPKSLLSLSPAVTTNDLVQGPHFPIPPPAPILPSLDLPTPMTPTLSTFSTASTTASLQTDSSAPIPMSPNRRPAPSASPMDVPGAFKKRKTSMLKQEIAAHRSPRANRDATSVGMDNEPANGWNAFPVAGFSASGSMMMAGPDGSTVTGSLDVNGQFMMSPKTAVDNHIGHQGHMGAPTLDVSYSTNGQTLGPNTPGTFFQPPLPNPSPRHQIRAFPASTPASASHPFSSSLQLGKHSFYSGSLQLWHANSSNTATHSGTPTMGSMQAPEGQPTGWVPMYPDQVQDGNSVLLTPSLSPPSTGYGTSPNHMPNSFSQSQYLSSWPHMGQQTLPDSAMDGTMPSATPPYVASREDRHSVASLGAASSVGVPFEMDSIDSPSMTPAWSTNNFTSTTPAYPPIPLTPHGHMNGNVNGWNPSPAMGMGLTIKPEPEQQYLHEEYVEGYQVGSGSQMAT